MTDYIIASTIGLGVSYMLYRFFLKREKAFGFNRFFLLGSLVLCLLAPILEIDFGNRVPVISEMAVNKSVSGVFMEKHPEGEQVEIMERENTAFWETVLIFYFLVSGIFIFRFLRNLFQILGRIKNNPSARVSGLRAVLVDENISPYSFFHSVFINKKDFQNGNFSDEVVQHELAHSKQLHSIDVVFLELLTCFLWFNPFLWLYKKAVVENHEFLADAAVVDSGANLKSYSEQLVLAGNNKFNYPLISGFNFSLTKNRIIMLHKKRSSKILLGLKIGLVLSLSSLIVTLTSCSRDANGESFLVVIDAGHGGKDSGFSNEKQINLQIAKRIEALADADQAIVFLVRDGDEYVTLKKRVQIANAQKADFFVSLHTGVSKDKAKKGVVVSYAPNGKNKEKSHEYSKILVSNYIKEINMQGQINEAGFFVLRELEMPGVMVNLGFLSNEKEAKQLNNPEFQQKIAQNIYASLLEIKESR